MHGTGVRTINCENAVPNVREDLVFRYPLVKDMATDHEPDQQMHDTIKKHLICFSSLEEVSLPHLNPNIEKAKTGPEEH